MNQILQQACKTRCIPKPIGEIIISLLMKFQNDQRCVIKCQFHELFQFFHPMLLCLTHSLLKLKPKIDFYLSMFCPNKFFQLSLFVGYISPILISLLVVLSTFKFWSMLSAIMKTTPRTKIFILEIWFCIQKSTLIIYQMVIKLGISKPTFMHNIHMLSTK